MNVIGCKYRTKVSQRLRWFQVVYKQLFQANIGENPNKSFHIYQSGARASGRKKVKQLIFNGLWLQLECVRIGTI